jgi:tRNA (guanine-N7-)-methyltransferase
MRIRNKPWAKEELLASNFYVQKPEDYKGRWKEFFNNENEHIYLELGCGKGFFVKKAAKQNQNINYIAIDLIDAILGMANRNIIEEFENKEVLNLALTRYDVEEINNILDQSDNIERIYINFCNPWPKPRHKKRRLTHTRQLEKYKQFLAPKGEIYFKTDDDELFRESLEYFKEAGFEVVKTTENLNEEPDFWENIETEHEIKFKNEGIKIKAGIFRLK